MMGWWLAWKCLVACRFGESSQQPTWPQVRQSLRCTHLERVFRHSSQPRALGVTSWIDSKWVHSFGMTALLRVSRRRAPAPPRGDDLNVSLVVLDS